ncbi:unnamed protein product, partial [Allacma fusca]
SVYCGNDEDRYVMSESVGVGFVLRKLGSTSKPETEIEEQDGNWRITTKTAFKTTEI